MADKTSVTELFYERALDKALDKLRDENMLLAVA
jgi:hypothetical protein